MKVYISDSLYIKRIIDYIIKMGTGLTKRSDKNKSNINPNSLFVDKLHQKKHKHGLYQRF